MVGGATACSSSGKSTNAATSASQAAAGNASQSASAANASCAQAGTRKIPMVVDHRYIWDCSHVDINPVFDADFFVIPFPKDHEICDLDSGKKIGALEPKPLVKVGQEAPPLVIARWLDGKQHRAHVPSRCALE